MSTRSRRAGIVITGVVLGLTSTEGLAFAGPDEREQCATSAEQAQQSRDEGKYRRARQQMLFCAREVCPGPIKSDCSKWLSELDRDAPTVVFGAREANGADLLDVKVSMDGTPIQERLDGKPVLVDSGEHKFTFETKTGAVKEERVLIRAAEKARPIIATFPSSSAEKATEATVPGSDKPTSEGSMVPALVVGGIGLVALGSFGYFGLTGKSEVDDLQKCKPNCNQDDVDAARSKLIIADISLGIGVVALGVAAYMFLTRSSEPAGKQASSVRVDVLPVRGGGVAGIGAAF